MSAFREPEDRWEPWPVDLIPMGGPDRIYVEHDNWRPPRVGFAPPKTETDPLLWDGDQA